MAAPKEKTIGLAQFLFIVGVAVVVFLGWDLQRRVADTMRLSEADAQADLKIQALEQENASLTQLKKDVSTDEWVEYECRVLLRCARDNETIFVPMSTPVPNAPLVQAITPPTPVTKPFWRSWLDTVTEVIFGPAP